MEKKPSSSSDEECNSNFNPAGHKPAGLILDWQSIEEFYDAYAPEMELPEKLQILQEIVECLQSRHSHNLLIQALRLEYEAHEELTHAVIPALSQLLKNWFEVHGLYRGDQLQYVLWDVRGTRLVLVHRSVLKEMLRDEISSIRDHQFLRKF